MKVALFVLILGCISAQGQDRGVRAAQQATQQASQVTQDAAQEAAQAAWQANQQAAQASQQAAQQTMQANQTLQGANQQVNQSTTQKSGKVAPLPAQFLAAKKVFISNRGSEEGAPVINGSVDLPYDEFYAFMNNWGKYELVTSPNEADLILEIGYRGRLHLVIFEPRTHVILWTFNQRLINLRQKDIDQAMVSLVDQLRAKAGAPPLPKAVVAQKHLW